MAESALTKEMIEKVNSKVYKDHALYFGVVPRIIKTADGGAVLTYDKKNKTEEGLSIKLSMRVTVDAKGNIRSVSGSK